jgi:flavin-dependent dehydrogenase
VLVGDAFGFVDPMLSPGLCIAMLSAEKLADAIPATGGCDRRTPAVLKTYWRWFATQLEAWQELVGYFYDGRIFATVKQGMHLMERYPGRPGEIIQRHIEKNLSGMASGAYTTRWYSRLLLRVLVRFSLGRFKPDDYAIR